MINFYYFYTPDYEFWNNHLKDTLDKQFNLNPILVEKINLSNVSHHFLNVSIKIELLIESIKKNMNNYIIFSDATIFVNKNNLANLNEYISECLIKNKDIMFTYLQQDPINIGFMLINCNEKTLFFWEEVLKKMKTTENSWDQGVVNNLLSQQNSIYNIDYDFFNTNKIWCGGLIPSDMVNSFLIYKSCVNPQSNRQKDRLNYLLTRGLINQHTYDNYLPK
jgi:hypothetical protein